MSWFNDDNRFKEMLLSDLVEAKRTGYLRLPIYQRDAVWSEGRICTLWDSILRGYPLPSFLVKSGGKLSRAFQASKDEARGLSIEQKEQETGYDLLDGQQRMSAIDAVYSFNAASTIRIWVDIGEIDRGKIHPHKNKYWIHACTKIFPFGFSAQPAGEFDFKELSDYEIDGIWKKVHKHFEKSGWHEFYDYQLDKTFPVSAKCPVPLDLVMHGDLENLDTIKSSITRIAGQVRDGGALLGVEIGPADPVWVDSLARSILKANNYRLGIQLMEVDGEEEDEYNLFERIGRGGVQITQRQLAVSKLIMLLGKGGNDAISRFGQSQDLKNMLETEDVIHGLARVAYARLQLEKDRANYGKDDGDVLNKDLIELTPQRLKTIENDRADWQRFRDIMNEYCDDKQKSRLQSAFERMYASIRYDEENKNGFSKAQLAQPDKNSDDDGIAPISLHPLLYWHITNEGETPGPGEKDDMVRWLLFVNGFVKKPKHNKLNRIAFLTTVTKGRVDFSEIKGIIYSSENDQLRRDLELIKNQPVIDAETREITFKEVGGESLLTTEEASKLFKSNVLLNNWVNDKINWFVLLWNQRELVSHLYNDILYVPALYSKGRPFDLDHIVARNRLIGSHTYITDDIVRESLLPHLREIEPDATIKDVRLLADNFRKNLPYSIANYRYWPRKLNRSDHDDEVQAKMKIDKIKITLADSKLLSKFAAASDDDLWEWCSIPAASRKSWSCLPPQRWEQKTISLFFEQVADRHEFLYNNAYDFLIPCNSGSGEFSLAAVPQQTLVEAVVEASNPE